MLFKAKYLLVIVVVVSQVISSCSKKTPAVNLNSLLEEMTDKAAITRFPDPYYITKQFSSYDRRSDLNSKNDYEWFANDDSSNFIRTDTVGSRIEHVMFDAKGPGAVVRLWMTAGGANPGEGILRMYIDGDSVPLVEGKPFEMINEYSLAEYPLSASLSINAPANRRGYNLYLPFPYKTSCKITYESQGIKNVDPNKSEMFYYNINYRTYMDEVVVESVSNKILDSLKGIISDSNERLNLNNNHNEIKDVKSYNIQLNQGESKIEEVDGTGQAISKIKIKLKADDVQQALRSTVLKIEFDGEKTVYTPIGDFFGTGYELNSFKTWYTEVSNDSTMSISYLMPFKQHMKIFFENQGKQFVTLNAEVALSSYNWDDNSMYFGASWHQYSSLSTGENKERNGKGGNLDVNFVSLKGKGVFVGDALSIYNSALPGHWKAWWGEGDEKIYIDGESFPSHFGTGTEDYYGYAWCRPETYSHPFIAQPIGKANMNTGLTINSRYRSLDAIPFKESLHFDMELWHWVKTKVDYAPVTYYYMFPGGKSNFADQLQGIDEKVARKRKDVIVATPDQHGVLEGEDLILDELQEDQVIGEYGDELSGGLQLLWTKADKGKVLRTGFVMEKQGDYNIKIALGYLRDDCQINLSVNDIEVLNNVKIKNDSEVKLLELNGIALKKGNNSLKIEVVNNTNTRFGIDFLEFQEIIIE
ncbi:Protein of unknown function [Zhouia amylolytica]|uniref:DUF2961 domain-containing protein n=1 Tax=Zhouia amylolytica TaxID=376730 RepID=A0A1I6T8C7_9FLAO|nr:glycoside hydrolase family 172 protein [Zhouia amylolytica]SFS85446.1 Protein of unknown function [Zhouia amylolytica]